MSESDFDPKASPELDRLARAVMSIERDLGLPADFLNSIHKGDDWTVIIRTHALVESMVSHLLTHAIGDVRLSRFFERLELGNVQTGKLALAGTLELLEPKERRFIKTLGELRNRLVHDIRNVNFNPREYFEALDKNQRRAFLEATTYWTSEPPEKRLASLKGEPQNLIWISMLALIVRVNDRLSEAKSHHEAVKLVMGGYDRFVLEMENYRDDG